MSKRVTIPQKPRTALNGADRWVKGADTSAATKRLTLDIPADLHRRIKSACALSGQDMATRLREILEREF